MNADNSIQQQKICYTCNNCNRYNCYNAPSTSSYASLNSVSIDKAKQIINRVDDQSNKLLEIVTDPIIINAEDSNQEIEEKVAKLVKDAVYQAFLENENKFILDK